MRVRAGLVTAIYKKALVLSNDERGRSSGDIVNLMSVDTVRLQDLCTYGLMVISAPIQVGWVIFLCKLALTDCRFFLLLSHSTTFWVGQPSSELVLCFSQSHLTLLLQAS